MSDTIKSIGKIIEGTAEKDAIHVAVAPVIASHRLQAGQHVGLNKEGKATYAENVDYIGVVDPFLNAYVMPGDRFWLFLYPGSITSLRHQWSHPAFQEATEPSTVKDTSKEESEAWLRGYAERYWTYTPPGDRPVREDDGSDQHEATHLRRVRHALLGRSEGFRKTPAPRQHRTRQAGELGRL